MEALFFWLLAAATAGAAAVVVVHRNPVTCALALAGAFVALAAVFVTLEAFFLAVVQVIVYAGAVMVLFLFVIMLLNVPEEQKKPLSLPKAAMAGALGLGWFVILGIVLPSLPSVPLVWNQGGIISGANEIGLLLFSKYLLPFLITGVLLLVATLGVVLLARKESE